MLSSTIQEYQVNPEQGNYNILEKDFTDFAHGRGLSGNWMTRGNFVFEVNDGFGRNLCNANDDEGVLFVAKLGFNLGYRFQIKSQK